MKTVADHPEGLERAFGHVVRATRQVSGLSQETLADKSGLHRTYISEIERGLKSPSLGAMSKIACALERPLDDLLRESLDHTYAAQHRKR